jgi:PleD family two-component response regulator
VILPETPRTGAEVAAERMRTKMEDLPTDFEKDHLYTTVTVGGASLDEEVQTADALIALCVDALKLGITTGGNTVNFPL